MKATLSYAHRGGLSTQRPRAPLSLAMGGNAPRSLSYLNSSGHSLSRSGPHSFLSRALNYESSTDDDAELNAKMDALKQSLKESAASGDVEPSRGAESPDAAKTDAGQGASASNELSVHDQVRSIPFSPPPDPVCTFLALLLSNEMHGRENLRI